MGTVERRDREKAERRRTILAAARNIFTTEGFATATMPAIAEAAQLAPGTIYLYFPSKDSLYAELLVEGYQGLEERLRAAIAVEAPPRRCADAFIDAYLAFSREHPEYLDIVSFVAQREAPGGVPVLDTDQVRRIREREDACKVLADKMLGRSDYGTMRDVRGAVDAIWCMLTGLALFLRHADQATFFNAARQAKAIILDSVFPGAGQAS